MKLARMPLRIGLALVAFGVAALGAVTPVGQFATPPLTSAARIHITWSENPLEVVLFPGGMTSRDLTVTSNRNLEDVRLHVSSTLRSFLEVCVLRHHDRDEAHHAAMLISGAER